MPPVESLMMSIEGMHCGGCVNRVTQALKKLDGVIVDLVEVGSARVQYDPSATGPQAITEAVKRIGFAAKAVS